MTITVPSSAWIRRDDLALFKWTRPPMIVTRFLPTMPFDKKVDVVVYMPIRDDNQTAQTDRAMGGALDITTIDNVRLPVDLTSSKFEKTFDKDISDIAEQKDLERNLWQMAMNGKAVVAYAVENAGASALLDSQEPIATSTAKDFVLKAKEARQSVSAKLGDGKIIAGMSQAVFNYLVTDTDIKEMIKTTVSIPVTQDMTVANVQKAQLAALIGVDEVQVGQNRAWYADNITNKDAIIIALVPEPNMDPDYIPQLGRTPTFTQYLAAPTPNDPNAGQPDYDESMLFTGGAVKEYATPFSCAQIVLPGNSSIGVTTQTFAKPVVFPENLEMLKVVGMWTTVSPSVSA